MRQGTALLIGLLSCLLAGCMSVQPVRSTSAWLDRFLHPAGPTGPDAVQMDVALLECPLGDRYINRTLWMDADEQVIALENRAGLEDSGFRIGQIGGITPVGLQALLTSERTCANPRRIRTLAGKATKLVLGPELPVCSFQSQREGAASLLSLEQAQCTLEIVPTLTADGRTTLRIVPQVFHGETKLLPKPAADLSGWMLQEERASERFADLTWEVTLAPGEYLIVGGRFDRPQTLGHQCFLRGDERTPMQRLLVIRTARADKGVDEPFSPLATEGANGFTPALANHAAHTTVRGSSR